MSGQQEPSSERTSSPGRAVDARALWSGGAATAVVAALIALAGILVCRWLLGIPVLAPRQDGAWGDASSAGYAIAAAAALAATTIMHLLLIATPRPQMFFTWIIGLVWRQALPVDSSLGEYPEASEVRPGLFTRFVPVAGRDGQLPPIQTTSVSETPPTPLGRAGRALKRLVFGPPLDASGVGVIVILLAGNLRGVRQAGAMFVVPRSSEDVQRRRAAVPRRHRKGPRKGEPGLGAAGTLGR